MSNESIVLWMQGLQEGDDDVARKLWEEYFSQMLKVAKSRLGHHRRVADEEDIALSALNSFCVRAREGKFPQLNDREDLWKLLFTITDRKAIRQLKHQSRQKRGGGDVRGESILMSPGGVGTDSPLAERAVDLGLSPDVVVEVTDEFCRLLDLLDDTTLRTTAIMKMEGFSVDEIAEELKCSSRSVKRKLRLIREVWSQEEGESAIELDD